MPVLGLGTDIVEIARFTPSRLSGRFLTEVFTDSELAYCLGKPRREQHLAVRFAAKEAAVKALMAIVPFVSVFQVEVTRDQRGAPGIALLAGRHGEPAPELPNGALLHVSLSHSTDYAVATVIIEMP